VHKFPFLEFSPITDQEVLRACGVPGFSFLAAFFMEPDLRETGMFRLRVIDRFDRADVILLLSNPFSVLKKNTA
jgi:hypothetical protein